MANVCGAGLVAPSTVIETATARRPNAAQAARKELAALRAEMRSCSLLRGLLSSREVYRSLHFLEIIPARLPNRALACADVPLSREGAHSSMAMRDTTLGAVPSRSPR